MSEVVEYALAGVVAAVAYSAVFPLHAVMGVVLLVLLGKWFGK